MLAYGLSAPFAGQLIDRLGARVAYGFGLASLGCGYLLAGSATELWHYLLAVGLLGGLGSRLARHDRGLRAAVALVHDRIGTIMSLPYAAIGAGMLILPPLTQFCLSIYRLAHGARVLGAGVLLVLPLVMLAPLERMTAGSPEWRAMRNAGRRRRRRAVDGCDGAAHGRFLGSVCRLSLHRRWRPTASCRTRSPI